MACSFSGVIICNLYRSSLSALHCMSHHIEGIRLISNISILRRIHFQLTWKPRCHKTTKSTQIDNNYCNSHASNSPLFDCINLNLNKTHILFIWIGTTVPSMPQWSWRNHEECQRAHRKTPQITDFINTTQQTTIKYIAFYGVTFYFNKTESECDQNYTETRFSIMWPLKQQFKCQYCTNWFLMYPIVAINFLYSYFESKLLNHI